MRVLFAGSPAIAVPSLEAAFNTEGIKLAGVLTNPDTPKGRHGTAQPTEVGEAAERLLDKAAFSVFKPDKLGSSAREHIDSLKPDLLVSFAYGKLFGPKFLSLFPLGGINIHPSLLPKYRGPSPIQSAIINRDTITGITMQTLANEMDCGDILAVEQVLLTGKETTGSLSDIMAGKAAEMLPEVLKNIALGKARGIEQNHNDASYCTLISKETGVIDWNQSALKIEALIRGFSPWPLCRTIHNGRELLILKADIYNNPGISQKSAGMVLGIDKQYGILIQTGDGVLAVTELQYQAKKALFWRDFINGARDFTGSDCPVQLG
ncbi:MAG: methionyl-tRNA formyltransferase [Treponema sp.]|nr:methionyl-tRNA formyltransferase [Treponema sp.]